MNFTPTFLAVKQLTGNKPDPFPWYAIMAGMHGKLKFQNAK